MYARLIGNSYEACVKVFEYSNCFMLTEASLGYPFLWWLCLVGLKQYPPLQVLNVEQNEKAARNEYNFDHPGLFCYLIITIKVKPFCL